MQALHEHDFSLEYESLSAPLIMEPEQYTFDAVYSADLSKEFIWIIFKSVKVCNSSLR